MKRWLAVFPVVAVAACGPTKRFDQDLRGREKPSEIWFRADVSHVRRVIPAPLDDVWRLLPASVASLQFPGTPAVYPEDRIIVTPRMKIEGRLYPDESNSEYLRCGSTIGGQPAADEYQVIFAVMARLAPRAADSTEIDVIVDGTAQDMKERSQPVRCYGTGRFENTIIDHLLADMGIPNR
jgi:hypothetical protein